MASEIICPFCQVRRPLAHLAELFTFSGLGDLSIYFCSCGALASPSGSAIGGGVWPLEDMDEMLCTRFLKIPRSACDVDVNTVTQMNPPLQLLWVKPKLRST